MENVMNNTSKVFESHIRIQMIASLSIEDLTYKQMKEILGCTDGNMTTHTKKLIQEGFGRGKTGGLTSYEFEFSVENEAVFKQLEENSGKQFDLHYKEYNGAIPWRGNTKYVVDKVVNMK